MPNHTPTKIRQVVCLGGGTGTFSVVTALKQLPVEITAVIAVSDSGGSTGRIRDEFGFQAIGDLRQSLAALADPQGQEWIQKLLLYRFDKGTGLAGHNLGNLLLTALQDMTGSTTKALEVAERVFQLSGKVIPVTETTVDLEITYATGKTAIGEHVLDTTTANPLAITGVKLIPECSISPKAADALSLADLIIIGPGDYYASLMACLVVPGVAEAISSSEAQVAYICNLMTRRTQTHNMSAQDHVSGIEQVITKNLEYIVLNSKPIPPNILQHYATEEEFPVRDNLGADPRVIRAPVANTVAAARQRHDTAHRSVLRHDPTALRNVLAQLLERIE